MINQLKQANFDKVYKVIDSIQNHQKEAIPKLIELLKDTSYVKLTNTADLIYPGTKEFYGHGWIVNYDIDWISVRAGWILEKLTFQDFGYLNRIISEDSLMSLHKRDYAKYLTKGYHDIDFKDKTPREQLIIYRLLLAAKVEKWWIENQSKWNRFSALRDALASSDSNRQYLALAFLGDGTAKKKCDGLTIDSYQKILKPLIQKIYASNGKEKIEADRLLQGKPEFFLKRFQ